MTKICLILMLLLCFSSLGWEEPVTTETVNQNMQWWEGQFRDHLKRLESKDGKVVMEFDGILGRQAETVTLAVGEEFIKMDHHGSHKFVIKEIQAEGITVEYESRFDHRSFGKDLISVDRGTLKLLWKAQSGPKSNL